jgi:hypothetical protein
VRVKPVEWVRAVLAQSCLAGNDVAMTPAQNGRPEITDTGARVKTQNGAGYAPPSARDGEPRFGTFGSEAICDPYEDQED